MVKEEWRGGEGGGEGGAKGERAGEGGHWGFARMRKTKVMPLIYAPVFSHCDL